MSFPLVLCLTSLHALLVSSAADVPLVQYLEQAGPPEPTELFYDSIFLKFDPECTSHGAVNLKEHFSTALKAALVAPLKGKSPSAFASVSGGEDKNTSVRDEGLPNAEKFSELLDGHLLEAASLFVVSAEDSSDLIDAQISGIAAGRRLEHTSVHRRLAEVPQLQREAEIMGSLHLLAASRLVGEEHAVELVQLERSGNSTSLIEFIERHKKLTVQEEGLARLKKQLGGTRVGGGGGRSFQSVGGEGKGKAGGPVITETEVLSSLGIRIIKNPLLEADLLRLANLLPCIEFEAEPDRSKIALGSLIQMDSPKPKRFLEPSLTGAAWPALVNITPDAKKREYTFQGPNDAHFSSQWYLMGPSQKETYGTQVIDGWSSLLRDRYLDSHPDAQDRVKLDFANLAEASPGMTVAVLDSGCSQNGDLVNRFWRNTATAGCTPSTFVGDGTNTPDSHGIADDCIGYDFGNDQPDPTVEVEGKIHGSSTAGLIAAEANNKIGIAGICPQCQIVCIKIYDSEKQKITMTSVVRALDYLARKKVKVSNHSYGGFGASSIEFSAHEALARLGHLAVCSSGNNGCNIDIGTTDPKACKGETGQPMGPFTPASYDIPSIMSIGGTTKKGELAWFSNYGEKSVDVFAPGDDIITLYGKTQLASVKGTSFSSPIVAGLAAVLWSAHPELSAKDVKERLVSTGIPIRSLLGKAKEPRIVSLAHALDLNGTNYYPNAMIDSAGDKTLIPFLATLLLLPLAV